jgi:transposase
MDELDFPLKRFAGLDIAKESVFSCIVDNTGFKLQERFDTKTKSLYELKIWLKQYNVEEVAMENTGIYSEPVIAILKDFFTLCVVNASDTKRKNNKKSDPDDAWWLAELLKSGTIGKGRNIKISYLGTPEQNALKKLTRLKAKYVDMTTNHKNRINKTFSRLNIKIFDHFSQNKFTNTAIELYSCIAEGTSFETFYTTLCDKRNLATGIKKNQMTRIIHFLDKNKDKVKNTLVSGIFTEIPYTDRLALIIELQHLKLCLKTVEILDNEIFSQINSSKQYQEQLDIISSIPGIGETTGPQILAEIPPLEQFSSPDQFSSYSGLVPRLSQSAEVYHLGSISKRGPKYLREALYQSAQIASMKRDSSLGKKFSKLYKRKGTGKAKIAWVAVARHLARIIFVLLTRKEKFKDYSYRTKPWKLARRKLEHKTIYEIAKELSEKNYFVSIISKENSMRIF